MKSHSILLIFALLSLWIAPLQAQTSVWDKASLGAAPATDDELWIFDTSAGVSKNLTIANLFTGPAIAAYTLTGTGTIGNGCTLTTPVLSGSITGTYTLAGTPTITAPTINAYTLTGTGTIASGLTATSPALLTPTFTDATEVVTATNVITAAESGSVFYLNSSTEFVSTLPAPAAGLHYTFVVTAAPSGASYTVVTNSSSNVIVGQATNAAGAAGDTGTTDDTVSFVDGQAAVGDTIEVWSDGTKWYIHGKSAVAAGITFTTAS